MKKNPKFLAILQVSTATPRSARFSCRAFQRPNARQVCQFPAAAETGNHRGSSVKQREFTLYLFSILQSSRGQKSRTGPQGWSFLEALGENPIPWLSQLLEAGGPQLHLCSQRRSSSSPLSLPPSASPQLFLVLLHFFNHTKTSKSTAPPVILAWV